MPSLPLAVFRADADPRIGGGHIMRCLTLAAAFRRVGWRCAIATIAASSATVPALAKSGHTILEVGGDPIADAHRISEYFGAKADLLIIDHPGWAAIDEAHLRPAATMTMAIDGLRRRHATDLWLDPNPDHALEDLRQQVAAGCDILLGLQFMPIAPAVVAARDTSLSSRRDRGFQVGRVLVNFGAGDQSAALELALRGIAQSGRKPRTTVVAGTHVARCRALAGELALECEILVWSDQLGELMLQADLMIGAAGISAWERCCLGLPSLVTTIAENQLGTARFLASQGAAVNLGPAGSLSPHRLAESLAGLADNAVKLARMSSIAAGLVDGLGAERVVAAVVRHCERARPEPAA